MLSFWPLGAFIMAFGLYLMQKNIFGNKFHVFFKTMVSTLVQWAQTAFVHDIAVLIIMTSKHFWLLQST